MSLPMIETRWDPDSLRPFTIDHIFKTTTWARPQAWERRFDRVLNKDFFYNVDTKEISWTAPQQQQSYM